LVRIKRLTGYVEMMLENPENLFILANLGSDKVNLHQGGANLAKPCVPRGLAEVKKERENKNGLLPREKRRWMRNCII
jgi:hypothetical protein